MSQYRKGLVWISRQTLMIQPNHLANAATPMGQRGPGYRLPTDSSYAPLSNPTQPVTATEIIDATNFFYDQSIHPHTICFGGGGSEPLATLPTVMEAMEAIRAKRHGVPLVLMTNGLNHSNHTGSDPVDDLIELHEQWRNAPGADGDSKFSVFVNIAGANPPQYQKVMAPTDTKKGFQEMTSFVARLAESGLKVYGTASEHPQIKIKQVRTMAMGIGCSDFFQRSYHDRTLYDVLDLDKNENDASAIKRAYHEQAKALHPDVNRTNEEGEGRAAMMSQVTEAFEVLGDVGKKELYDNGVADLVLNENETDYFSTVVTKSV